MVVNSHSDTWHCQVEEALLEHDCVAEAAVISEPNDYLGEAPVAVLCLEPEQDAGCHQSTVDRVLAFVASKLAPYEVPIRIVVTLDSPTHTCLAYSVPGAANYAQNWLRQNSKAQTSRLV